jgi:nitrogen fixation NifU-like protein
MMSDLRALYQEVILDHYKRPRNFRILEEANRDAEGYNPLCGDRVKIFLQLEGDVIKEIAFQGTGCAISTASASLMTQSLKGKTLSEVEELFERFHDLVTGKAGESEPLTLDDPTLGKLGVLGGVREYPIRVKCATLAWHTLRAALHSQSETVSTE